MTAIIIHSYAARLSAMRGWQGTGATVSNAIPGRGTRTSARLSAAAADLNSLPVSVAATVHREPAGYLLAGTRADGRDLCFQRRQTSYRTARNNSIGGKSPRALPGNARIEPSKQSFRGVCQAFFQGENSFPVASAFHVQIATGGVGNVRKAFGEIQNVQC